MPVPRDETIEDLYWDLEYNRTRGEGYTEIECGDCAEWSPRTKWQHGTVDEDESELALLCPQCNHAESSADGSGLMAVR